MSKSANENSEPTIRFSLAELVLLNNAMNEILNGPDALKLWEFETRTGATIEEADALLSKLNGAIARLEPSPTVHSTRTR